MNKLFKTNVFRTQYWNNYTQNGSVNENDKIKQIYQGLFSVKEL